VPAPVLGLPTGSVRALLALLVVGRVLRETLAGRPIGVLLSEALLIILAHYFASRRLLDLPEATWRRLEAEGVLEAEPSPLWLPRYSVRLLIVAGFAVTALILWWQGRLLEPGAFANIGLFAAYLAGVLYRWVMLRRARPLGRWSALWPHLKAVLALGACAVLLVYPAGGVPGAGLVEKVLLAVVLFYFGAR
jgi:hypothetical protein